MVFSQALMRALHDEVVGQEYAITALTRAVTLALAGMRHPSRPLGVLAFVGPTGSGKSYVAQALGRVLMVDECRMVYVDCQRLGQASDPFSNLHDQLVAGLCNSQLATAFNQSAFAQPSLLCTAASLPIPTAAFSPGPFSIVVFDEADKAPAPFRENLCGAIDQGWMQSNGDFFWLGNALIILTATVSKKKTDQLVGRTIGFFGETEAEGEAAKRHLLALEEMDSVLGPRLVSRVDEIIIFERMNERDIVTLLDRKLSRIRKFLGGLGIGFVIDQPAKSFLLGQGLEDLAHGVRQIKRAVGNFLEFPLADLMLSGRLLPGMLVSANYQPPRSFLNFQIMIPQLVPPDMPLMKPIALEESAID
jgi:ATP-dependent Clp protease ATP-binding subunit ClpA